MGISNLYQLSAIVTPLGQIAQITDGEVNPQVEEFIEAASGVVDPSFIAINEEKPMFSFTTTAVSSALSLIGLDPYSITGETDLYFQRIAQGGLRSTSNAVKVSVSSGLIVAKSLRARQKDKATLSYELHATSADGTTAPLTVVSNATLPTINLVNELFTLGPVIANSLTIDSLQSVDLDFQSKVFREGSDGNAYPTYAGVMARRPQFKLSGYDLSDLSSFTPNGFALTAWGVYLRKIQPGGTRYPNGSAVHLGLTGTGGMLRPDTAKGTFDKEASMNWVLTPKWDGSTSIIQVAAGTTLSS